MSARRRHLLIGLLALLTLALAWFAPEPDVGVEVVSRPGTPAGPGPGPSVVASAPRGLPNNLPPLRPWPLLRDLEPLPDREAPASDGEGRVNTAAVVPAPVTPPPVAPVTPRLPFRYLGSLVVDEQAAVFLASGNDTIVARSGAALPGDWRLDGVQRDRLEFTFLPTDARQSLTIPAQ